MEYANNAKNTGGKTAKALRQKRFCYKPQYGVIVICQDEQHQRHTYEALKKQGLTLKVVTV